MPRRVPVLVCCALVAVLGACSGDDGGETSAPPVPLTTVPAATTAAPAPTTPAAGGSTTEATAPSDRIGCRVKVTGAIETEFTGKDDANAFTSDYYLSQAELDEALGPPDTETDAATDTTTADGGGGPDFTAPPRPEGAAPLIAWFLLNCQGGDVTVSLFSAIGSTRDDVPFGPGTYDIAPSDQDGDDPEQFSALVAFGTQPDVQWVTVEGGSIDIDRFDERGTKGTFEIPMRELGLGGSLGEREVRIEGTFEVTCQRGELCANRT